MAADRARRSARRRSVAPSVASDASSSSGYCRRRLTLAEHNAVPAVLNPAADDRDAKHVARRVGCVAAVLIDPVLDHVRPAAAVEAEREVDIRVGRVRVAVAESGGPQCVGFPDRELDEPVALDQGLLRRRARIVAPVTPGRLLQRSVDDGDVDGVCPRDGHVFGADHGEWQQREGYRS